MFNRIRQIHLFAAFVLTTFVLMYFITGFVMIFEETFERKDTSQATVTREIPGIREVTGDTLVSALRDNFKLNGQYQVRKNSAQTVLTFRRPGTETDVVIATHSDSVSVTTKKKNLVTVMHQFHRLHGYNGGLNYIAWAFVYDLSALSMIVFAFSGIYLWYKTERPRWPGWTILIGFTVFTAFTIFYLGHLQ